MHVPLSNRHRLAFFALLSLHACARGTGTSPPTAALPDAVELCISKVISLPGKMDGRVWDGLGTVDGAETLIKIASLAAKGGYAAVLAAAPQVASMVQKAKGPPDLVVRAQLGHDWIISTPMQKDSVIATYGASLNVCSVIEKVRYQDLLRFEVTDMDLSEHDPVGSKTLAGIPAKAIRDRVWTINGFDQVIEIEITLDPQ